MAAKHLTRKEIVQQDVIGKTLADTSTWVIRNRNYLIALGAVVVMATLGAFLWRQYSASREEAIQAAFGEALAKYHAPVTSGDTTPPQPAASRFTFTTDLERRQSAQTAFRHIAEEYSGSRLGDLSTYYNALITSELGQPDEAKQILQPLAQDSSYLEVRTLARNALGQMALSDKDYQAAIEQFGKIIEDPPANFPLQDTQLRLAESYENSGKLSEALDKYRQIVSEYPGGEYATQAQAAIRRIEPLVEPSVSSAETETSAATADAPPAKE